MARSPGSRRRYNDKIMSHHERADEQDGEFERIMREVQSMRAPPPSLDHVPRGQPVTLAR